MKITKIEINGFGKFHNKSIDLAEGLNIICGKNEAGKSTIHKFLEAMFFGFFASYKKNKIYTSDYSKYMPWVGDSYGGAVEYEIEDKTYRLERNLLKTNESVKLYDALTGKDLTDELNYDQWIRLPSLSNHLHVNKTIFNNTLSVNQDSVKTDDNLSKEAAELISDFAMSADGIFSVKKAISYLEKKKQDLGTQRQSKSLYGSAVIKLKSLKNEKDRILNIEEINKEKYVKIKQFKEVLENIKEKKKLIEINKRNKKIITARKTLDQYNSIKEEIAAIENKIDTLIVYKKVTSDLYQRYASIEGMYNEAMRSIVSYQDKLSVLSEKINNLKEEIGNKKGRENNFNFIKIQKDYDTLIECLDNLNNLNKQLEKEEENSKMENAFVNANNKGTVFLFFSFVFLGVSIILGIINLAANISLIYYIIASSIIALFFMGIYIVMHNKSKKAEIEFEQYDTVVRKTISMINLNEIEISRLLNDYGNNDADELKKNLEIKINTAKLLSQKEIEINKYEVMYSEIEKNYNDVLILKKQYQKQMKSILESVNLEDEHQLEIALDKREEYKLLKSRIENLTELLNHITENTTIEQIEKEADFGKIINEIDESLFDCFEDETVLSNQIVDIAAAVSRLEGEIFESEKEIRTLAEVEEEIYYYQNIVDEIEKKIDILDKAILGINEVSKNIHLQIAPMLNSHVSQIISKITGGKYSDVKVSEDLKLKVMDIEINKLVDVDSLSKGSIDQIYFALRFGLINTVLANYDLPVFLDECFAWYDDERLNNILKYISLLSHEKQILIFTCHKRERDILDEFKENYNLVVV